MVAMFQWIESNPALSVFAFVQLLAGVFWLVRLERRVTRNESEIGKNRDSVMRMEGQKEKDHQVLHGRIDTLSQDVRRIVESMHELIGELKATRKESGR